MANVPTYLLTGFLGSGKTTLIKRLLDDLMDDQKIAVIQNEFAPHNFDGQELKRTTTTDFDLLEVNNGSVFCVCLLSDFIPTFKKFLDQYGPDIVFFEASGLSDPVSVGEIFNAQILQEKTYLAGSVCIVDASRFLKIESLQRRMVHQVQIADKIIVNKTDLVKNLAPLMDKLNKMNPHSEKLSATYCEVDIKQLLSRQEKPQPPAKAAFQISAEDLGRPDINSFVYKTVKPIQKERVNEFLDSILTGMIRIKGYLYLGHGKTVSVQYAGSELKLETVEREINQTELITMGTNLSLREIKDAYNRYAL